MFCSNCGTPVDVAAAAAAEGEMTDAMAQVEITRINRAADVKIAQINAGTVRELADVDQAAELARAEGEVDGMENVLDTMAGDPPAENGPPIVVEQPAEPAEPEPVADMLPPPVEPTEPTDTGDAKASGFW